MLEGSRSLVGRTVPEVTTHFTGTVRLTTGAVAERTQPPVAGPDGRVVGSGAIYETYFHGPAYRVLRDAWRVDGVVLGRFAGGLPENHAPADAPTLAVPRLVELAFQTAGLAEIAEVSRMGLPFGFDRLELPEPGGEVESVARAKRSGDGLFDVDVTDGEGRVLVSLVGYRTAPLPGTVAGDAFRVLKA